MFRESIAPSAGNLDAIHGGLVNLMHQAHCVFLAGPEAHPSKIDIMDFIYNEKFHAMIDRKTPPYAPYVMKLVLSQACGQPLTVTNLIIHKSMRPQQKAPAAPATPAAPGGSNAYTVVRDDEDDEESPVRPRRKSTSNAFVTSRSCGHA
jgi:hypothetical protein